MEAVQFSRADRVRRALAGERVDRPPISFWGHNFAYENSGERLAEAMVRWFRRYDLDFIKIQSPFLAFDEGWGNRYRLSTEPAKYHELLEWAVKSAADLKAIRPLNPLEGRMGQQVVALRLIRQEVGPDTPIISTVFAPSMVLMMLLGWVPWDASYSKLRALMRDHPNETHAALAALRDTLRSFAQACLENGADGIFYAIKAASSDQMPREEYDRFLPYDRAVLDAAAGGWLNMLHLCGSNLYFDVVDDLPSSLLNWALGSGNPGLAAGRERANRAVIGGVSPKPRIVAMTPEEVKAEVRAALEETGGVRMMVGTGCVVTTDTPESNLDAIRDAVEEWASRRPARRAEGQA